MNSSYHTDNDRTALALAEKFDELGIAYNNGEGFLVVPGAHDWYTWDQLVRDLAVDVLWK